MRPWSRVTCGLAVLGLAAAPTWGQTNLLLNGDFEVIAGSTNPSYPNEPVSARVWLGDYVTMGIPNAGCTEPCDPLEGSWGSRNHWIEPLSPVQTWEKATGAGGSATTLTYQTVAVSSAATVSFSGWVHTGPATIDEVNTITITLYDGKTPSGTEIASTTVDQTLANPAWYEVTLGGTSASGFVTVAFETTTSSTAGAGAVHCDDWTVNSSVACGTQHATTGVSPEIGSQVADTSDVTISGSGLNLVTAVRLVNIAEGDVLEATITNNSNPAALVVTMPTQGAKAGVYNVVTLQPDCQARILQDAFAITNDNLLLNAGFEVPHGQGNAQIWAGDYRTYSGETIHNPDPMFKEGERGYLLAPGVPDGEVTSIIWQSVPVRPTDTLTFTGWAVVGPGANATNQATINIYDGDPETGTLLATDTIDKTDPATWNQVVFNGLQASATGLITVEAVMVCQTPCYTPLDSCAAAARLDDFKLLSDTPCGTSSTLASIIPDQGPHNADTTGVQINGSDLTDAVVRLVQVASETSLAGTVTTPGESQLIVDLPTNGQYTGLYSVLVGAPSCRPAVLIDGFEIICANPTTFSSVDPPALPAPQLASVYLTIMGGEMDMLATVSLKLADLVIPGTIQSGGTSEAIVAGFDLSEAPVGRYDVIGTRSDKCDDPAPLLGGFQLTTPEGELLENGDFEAEGQKGRDAQPVLAWTNLLGGPAPKYDGSTHLPPGDGLEEPNGYNLETDNRGSVDAGGNTTVTARIMQTVNVLANRNVTLTGFMWGNSSQVVVQHRVRILDGDENAEVLELDGVPAEYVVDSHTMSNWTGFSMTGKPTGTQVTVDWGFVNSSTAWNDAAATHVDQLSLTQAKGPCNDPFADTDKDGDVDQDDFAVFQVCYTDSGVAHPPIPSDPEYCVCFNVDDDEDVDESDLTRFEQCASGPGVAADPECD